MTTSDNLTTRSAVPAKQTFYFRGAVKAESHLATCGPSLAKKAKLIDKNGPTFIPRYRNGNGTFMYMPGSGFRSKLRGAACALILEALETQGRKRFDLKDAQLNRVGGIKQAGTESAMNMTAFMAMIAANPILGVFGAATPWVKGKVMVGHLNCTRADLSAMIVDGVRSDILKREPQMVEFLSDGALSEYSVEIERTKKTTLLKNEKRLLEKQVVALTGEAKKAAKEKIVALDAEIKELGFVPAQMPLGGYEAIPPGAEMDNKIALVGVSEIELGCFLAAFQRFAEAPQLGAHGAHGAGVISGTWEISQPGKGRVGTLTLEPFSGLLIDGQALLDARVAFEKFILTDACQPYLDAGSLMPAAAEEEGEDA